MQISDLRDLIMALPVVEGTDLTTTFKTFLLYDKKLLEKWRGTFEEGIMARAIILARKKTPLIEEIEMDQGSYSKAWQICMMSPALQEEGEF